MDDLARGRVARSAVSLPAGTGLSPADIQGTGFYRPGSEFGANHGRRIPWEDLEFPAGRPWTKGRLSRLQPRHLRVFVSPQVRSERIHLRLQPPRLQGQTGRPEESRLAVSSGNGEPSPAVSARLRGDHGRMAWGRA